MMRASTSMHRGLYNIATVSNLNDADDIVFVRAMNLNLEQGLQDIVSGDIGGRRAMYDHCD